MTDPTSIATLKAFIVFIGLPGTIGIVLSQVAEHLDAFQKLSNPAKVLILLAISIILPTLRYVLLTYVPDSTYAMLEPWYEVILQGVMVFIASQLWHKYIHNGAMVNRKPTQPPIDPAPSSK